MFNESPAGRSETWLQSLIQSAGPIGDYADGRREDSRAGVHQKRTRDPSTACTPAAFRRLALEGLIYRIPRCCRKDAIQGPVHWPLTSRAGRQQGIAALAAI